jgi:drug/metabolite transporter (DMT)-like permease
MAWLLLSFVFYAANGLLWKWAVQDEVPIVLISRRALFTFLIVLAAFLLSTNKGFNFIFQPQYYLVLLSCLLGTTGLILLVSFLKAGSITRLSYYSFLGIFLNSTMTCFLGKVAISLKMAISGIIILLGYAVFVWDESRRVKKEPILKSQHLILTLMTVCFSLSTYISWKVLETYEPLALMVTQEFMVFMITFIISLFISRKLKINPVRISFKYPMLAIVIMLAVYSGFMGLKIYNPIITSISGVISPILGLVGAVIFFKEKMNIVQLISFSIIIVAEVFFI